MSLPAPSCRAQFRAALDAAQAASLDDKITLKMYFRERRDRGELSPEACLTYCRQADAATRRDQLKDLRRQVDQTTEGRTP